MVLSCAFLGLGQTAIAAPDIELAPRLTTEDYGSEEFPGDYAIAVPVGEAGFYPSGAVRVTSIDNLYYQEGEEQTNAVQVRVIPKLDLIAEGSKSVFWGLLRGDIRQHDGEGSNANTADFRLRGFAHFDLDNRNRVDAEISHSILSEELGTGRTRGETDFSDIDSSDTYTLSRIGLTYSYGNPRSRGELTGGFSLGTLEYVENEEFLKENNRDMSILWGRFSYKLTGKTTLSARVSQRNYEYTDDDNSDNDRRDRDATTLVLSADWSDGGLWYGDAFVAASNWEYSNRQATNNVATSGNDTTLGANLYWAIRSYSTANFFVRQFIDDTTNGGSAGSVKTSNVGVRWKHGWSERFNTTIAFYKSSETSKDDANFESSDRRVFSLEGRLAVRRWLNVLVGATTDDLDSDNVESQRQLLYLGLEGNL